MRRALAFGAACGEHAGRIVRRARFEARPSIPVSVACVVANGVRECLGRLFEAAPELCVDLYEPAVPEPAAWAGLIGGASRFRVEGTLGAIELVFRPRDARRLVAAVFRERERSDDEALSAIEAHVLDRVAREIAALCAPLCGAVRGVTPAAGPGRCACWIEMRVGPPVEASIGIALECDPEPPPGPGLPPAALDEVALTVRAVFARGRLSLDALSRLEIGAVVPMETRVGAAASLIVDGSEIASGEGGVHEGSYAFVVRGVPSAKVID